MPKGYQVTALLSLRINDGKKLSLCEQEANPCLCFHMITRKACHCLHPFFFCPRISFSRSLTPNASQPIWEEQARRLRLGGQAPFSFSISSARFGPGFTREAEPSPNLPPLN